MKTYLRMMPTLLLYLGGVLAGWAGGGARDALIPLLLAFLLWHIVFRPNDWPRAWRAWRAAQVMRSLVALLVLLALAVLCLGIGRGFALISPMPLPVWLGVLVAILATPLQRLLIDPVEAAKMDALMDQMLVALDGVAPDALGESDADQLARLRADEAALRAALDAGRTDLDQLSQLYAPYHIFSAISVMKAEGKLTPELAKALISFTCDPAIASDLQGQEAPTFAFLLLQDDPDLIQLCAQSCLTLLRVDPEMFWDCPSPRTLRAAEQRYAGSNAQPVLRALRDETIRLNRALLQRQRAEALAEGGESADNPAP